MGNYTDAAMPGKVSYLRHNDGDERTRWRAPGMQRRTKSLAQRRALRSKPQYYRATLCRAPMKCSRETSPTAATKLKRSSRVAAAASSRGAHRTPALPNA
eukprot:6214110-Pleurochrysis_carterae.AAC.9